MWVVTVISPWEEPREYVLKAGKTMLGRHPGNDIVIPHDAASRLHAEIDSDLKTNTVTISDMGSTNGTWVNRLRIAETQLLRSGDQVHIGQHLLTLIERDHSTAGHTARLHGTQPLAREIIRQSIDKRAPVLYEVANRLNTIADLPLALSEVAHLARVALAADHCQLALAADLETAASLSVPRAIVRQAMEQRGPIVIADVAAEPAYQAAMSRAHALMCIPGIAEEEVTSVMAVYRIGANTQPFDDFDLGLAVAVSHEVAETVYRRQQVDKALQVVKLATTDRLTGLQNRRHFHSLAEPEFYRARRFGRPLAALTIDIDAFKEINARSGHAAGDQVLMSVAERCSANLREPHLLCRYGDDEFVVLLLECEPDNARLVADRLRGKVAATPVDTMAGQVAVSISTGWAALSKECPSLGALIEEAQVNRVAGRKK